MLLNGQSIEQVFYEMISKAKEIEGGWTRLIVLVLCLIIIAIINRKDLYKICIPTLLNIVLLFTPYLYLYLYQDTSYKRFFWTLPEGILVAYTIILIISRIHKTVFKYIVLIVMIVIIVITGNSIYSAESGFYNKADNVLQVDSTLILLSDTIMDIDSEPTCVIPLQAIQMIRVANPEIIQIAGRNYYGYMGFPDPLIERLISSVSSPNPDSEFVFSVADSKRMKFVVTMSFTEIDNQVASDYGYEFIDSVSDYKIYYNPNPGPDSQEWYITQYGPDWGQNYFYTVEDTDGNLVIIDGGHYGNVHRLERVIRDHGFHVSAWIFTTLSDRHYGAAYNLLNEDSSFITVDRIYIPRYSNQMLDIIRTNQADWEESKLETIEEFVEFISNMDNVTYVDAESDYDLIGLNMHIYHHWGDDVVEIGGRESSNGSMVFSISGNTDSMLFTADATLPIQESIFSAIGDTQFDYITANDHGNWTFDGWWYDSRNPRGIFIDEQSTALLPGGQAFDFYSYCVEKGYNVYTFATVPNRIVIR